MGHLRSPKGIVGKGFLPECGIVFDPSWVKAFLVQPREVWGAKFTGVSELTLEFAIQDKKKLLHIDLNEIRGFSAAQLLKS